MTPAETRVFEDGRRMTRYTDILCVRCEGPTDDEWFFDREPRVKLCPECAERACNETIGVVAEGTFSRAAIRYVAGEAEPGKSSGRVRRSAQSLGSGENGNGVWDNIVRAFEEGVD